MIRKTLIFIFGLVIMISLVSAATYDYFYNPYTASQDRSINLDFMNDTFVNIEGDTMTGVLNMGGNNITNIANLTFNQDPANHKIYTNLTCVIIEGDTSELRIC